MRRSKENMDRVSRHSLQSLISNSSAPTVSIYLPIEYHGGAEKIAEPLRLRRLLEIARERLIHYGGRQSTIDTMLEPVLALAVDNKEFWLRQSQALVLFVAPGTFQQYRVPVPVTEQVHVGDHFMIKPLLPCLHHNDRFYLLTLSQNHVRLFRGDRVQLEELTLAGVPTNLEEATRYDQFEISLQAHSTSSASVPGLGRRAEMFHGHGSAGEESLIRKNITNFLHQVDRGVNTLLAEQTSPLLLMGVDTMVGYYREVNHYRHLLESALEGSTDRLEPQQYHERAWAIIAPILDQPRQDAIQHYANLLSQQKAAKELHAVPLAACGGSVDTLFVNPNNEYWGKVNLAERTIEVHDRPQPGDQELINFAACHTLLNNGKLYTITANELPDGASLAAILRYGLRQVQPDDQRHPVAILTPR